MNETPFPGDVFVFRYAHAEIAPLPSGNAITLRLFRQRREGREPEPGPLLELTHAEARELVAGLQEALRLLDTAR